MANAYPSPCDKCDRAANCGLGYGCTDWQIRYRYRQHQINAYAKRAAEPRSGRENKFTYQHPDEIRRYLANSPCRGCKVEKTCNVPCPDYLHWYNARMRVIRKKVGV